MVKATTASLANAIKGIRTKLVVILDGCPEEYVRLFDDTFGNGKFANVDFKRIATPSIGNQTTYAKQVEILSNSLADAEFLYFSEDDYIYKDIAFIAMMDFLARPEVDFVTPLDHPDRYSHIVPEKTKVEVRVSPFCHWREVGSTCCTFMCRSKTFRHASKALVDYAKGSGDGGMWIGITKDNIFSLSATIGAAIRYVLGKRKTQEGLEFCTLAAWKYHKMGLLFRHRYRLWGPIPTLAVHLCKPSLPPLADSFGIL